MAVTSPDNIWTPDSGDEYALTVDLAAMADTVQDAILNRTTRVVSDLDELHNLTPTAAGNVALVLALGGAQFVQNGSGVWVQTTEATVATPTARDSEYAKAAGVYRTQGAKVFVQSYRRHERWYGAYHATTNPGGKTPAGWYPEGTAIGMVPSSVQGGTYSGSTANMTSASSVILHNVFIPEIRRYRILIDVLSRGAGPITIRLVDTAGSVITSGVYSDQIGYVGDSTFAGAARINQATGVLDTGLYNNSNISVDMTNPATAESKRWIFNFMDFGAGVRAGFGAGGMGSSAVCAGLWLGGPSVTARINVMGYPE